MLDEEKSLLEQMERYKAAFEERRKELVAVRMKIIMEGFNGDFEKFEIAPELIIRRAPLKEREEFYSRTTNPKDIEYKAKTHEFFAEYDFQLTRGAVQGLAPGEGINIVSIFLAVCGRHLLNINKANFYVKARDEYRSAGFFTTPNEYRFFTSALHTNEDLELLKGFWPVFKSQYQENLTFALVARRYYYSILRLSFEDRLIDLMIALEALLVPETTGTKGDKLSARLAQLISSRFEYTAVQHQCILAYRHRNKIVHGGDIRKLSKETHDVNLISAYCQAGIQEYMLKYPGLNSRQLIKSLMK